jgi:hypothetical protein
MPLDFPANPSPNDIYSFGDKTWIWNGQGWALNPSGNITANNISVVGNVTAAYYFGNASQLEAVPNTTVSSSPPVSPEQGDIWIDSDTAVQFIYFNDGNSSQWAEMEAQNSFTTAALPQNIEAATVVATGNITAGNVISLGSVSATGNITGGNMISTGSVSATANITAGNMISTGEIAASGNITGNYILGDGSQLTGITAGLTKGQVTGITIVFGR